jgi:molybdopterin-containing oxidoreductase family iron-sulfur binding subunit
VPEPTLPTTDDAAAPSGRTYWQSFEHLADSPEVAEALDKEFVNYDPAVVQSLSRRRFLKYAAASMALAGVTLAGCRRWPTEVIAPYAHKPTDRVPGVPEFYATSWEVCGVGNGLLAESFDGRPIKLEGNPSHPSNVTRTGKATPDDPTKGWAAIGVAAQAQPLALYDPDRSRGVIERVGAIGQPRDTQFYENNLLPRLQAGVGKTAILCGLTASPTILRLREELEQQGARWFTWEPALPVATAAEAFGQDVRPVYHFDKAMTVVSLDADFLGDPAAGPRHMADWSALRASADSDSPKMSRVHAAECRYSLTGANADARLPIRPSRLPALARGLADAVAGTETEGLEPAEAKFVKAAAYDLKAHRGSSVVVCREDASPSLRLLVMRLNQELGNVGQTVDFIANPAKPGGTIGELAAAVADGSVETLVMLGGNPAYDAPADIDFASLLNAVPLSVHLSPYVDETSQLATVHVPQAHFLECWGDSRGHDGTMACQQPLILPLFNGLSPLQMLAGMLGRRGDGYAEVRQTFAHVTGTEPATDEPRLDTGFADEAGDKAFRKFLHDGVLPDTAAETVDVSLPAAALDIIPAGEDMEVVFNACPKLLDGRFANNGWLQELPEPMTKLAWDNAAAISVFDADRLGVRTNDLITVAIEGRTVTLPAYVMPGQPRGVVGLTLGYGRRAGGRIAQFVEDEGGGFDVNQVRTFANPTYATAEVAKTGGRYVLAMTQNHHLIDDVGYMGRVPRVGEKHKSGKVIRETGFDKHAKFVKAGNRGMHPAIKYRYGEISLQIFKPPIEFNTPHAWGMTIDMSACTGCSACVVACQSENNIPVTGKDGVLNNREMHWLRVDRYFKGEGEGVDEKKTDPNPEVVFQPMMCVHCENAPCEQVCPVAATVHDTEGLNTMVYNRCIGTRYCSNNCPYKVRRFNYLDYHYKPAKGDTIDATFVGIPDQQQAQIDHIKRMVFNPDVTVRMRGVMEKCTYCTQRIKVQTIYRKSRGEEIQDGDIKTACQQACPSEAIVFGNLNDPDARVTRQQKMPRAYGVLDELNTRPRTKYLAKLRNTLPKEETTTL